MEELTDLTHRALSRPRCGAYELYREVGRGGMGSVWEARHAMLARRAAVKLLHVEHARNPELLARFLREGVAAARIEHPHVAMVLDVGQEGDRAWLVLEFLDGEDLAQVLERDGPMHPHRALDVMLPVLAGLGAAHREGVVHRDLKPGNIVLSRDRSGAIVPKVIDFGFSKIQVTETEEDMQLTRVGTALGTLSYMPLEQIRSARTAGPACDQYAAAATLYRCLTGVLPYSGRNNHETFAAIVRGACRRPSELAPSLPPGLDAALMRALCQQPEGRFASVLAFGAALLPYASPAAQTRWAEAFGAPPGWSSAAPRMAATSSAPPYAATATSSAPPYATPSAPPYAPTATTSTPPVSMVPPRAAPVSWAVIAAVLLGMLSLGEFALLVARR